MVEISHCVGGAAGCVCGRSNVLGLEFGIVSGVPSRMRVTRGQIVLRGLTNCCPNCGGRTLFRKGSPFRLNEKCVRCDLRLERDEGFFLGSMSLNYGFTLFAYLVPVLLMYLAGLFSGLIAAVAAGLGAIGVPILFYRSSRSWWLMSYYFFFPHHLPANRLDLVLGEDENT